MNGWHRQIIDQARPHLAALVLFQTMNGTRISETLNIKWSDVDLENKRVHIWSSKTGQSRYGFLTDELVARLSRLPMVSIKSSDEERVFGYRNKSSVYNALKSLCKKTGLPYFSTHAFGRHAFASRLLADGQNLKTVASAGGWKSIDMVASRYGHLENGIEKQAIMSAGRKI